MQKHRQNRAKIDWKNYTPPLHQLLPEQKYLTDYDLAEIRKYIDWQPFFIAWEMHGKFPQILTDEIVGVEATKLYNDANALLEKIIDEKWLTAKRCYWFLGSE